MKPMEANGSKSSSGRAAEDFSIDESGALGYDHSEQLLW
jgi:hypothetical protein